MKKIVCLLLFFILSVSTQSAFARGGHSSGSSTHVGGYYRSNGTYVHPYTRGEKKAEDLGPFSSDSPSSPYLYYNKENSSTKKTTLEDGEYTDSKGIKRDSDGRIHRSMAAKHQFMKETGYPSGRPGYVVDHVIPLKRGGSDTPDNMQWQTIEEAKAKDKVE